MKWIVRDIIRVGRLLFEEGLVSARSGNISRSYGENIFITRTGSNMGSLAPEEIIALPLKEKSPLDSRASVELSVHREVILRTGKKSVVHAHPTNTLLIAFGEDYIEPIDSEGREILGRVPVLSLEKPSASDELAEVLSEVLMDRDVAVVRGHGAFAVHKDLFRAYSFLSTLEHSCKILVHALRR